jgi:hypothetical protein
MEDNNAIGKLKYNSIETRYFEQYLCPHPKGEKWVRRIII